MENYSEYQVALEAYAQLPTSKNRTMPAYKARELRYSVEKFLREAGISEEKGSSLRTAFLVWLSAQPTADSTKQTTAQFVGKFLYTMDFISKDDYEMICTRFQHSPDLWSDYDIDESTINYLVHYIRHDAVLWARQQPMYIALIAMLAGFGLRNSQLCALNVADVSIHDDLVCLRVAKKKANNKKGQGIELKRLPLDYGITPKHTLQELLAPYIECRRQAGNDEPFFLSALMTRLTARALQKIMERWRDALGIEQLHPHMFRHYMVTQIAGRFDILQAQMMAGHADIGTTLRYINPEHPMFSIAERIRTMEESHERSAKLGQRDLVHSF